jgi:hypothetical protein
MALMRVLMRTIGAGFHAKMPFQFNFSNAQMQLAMDRFSDL